MKKVILIGFIMAIIACGCKLNEPSGVDTRTFIVSGSPEQEVEVINKVVYRQSESVDDFEAYDNKDFIILYPGYWEAKEGYEGADAVFISPRKSIDDKFSENVNVLAQALSADWDMEKYTIFSVHQITAFLENGIVLESRPQILSGTQGRRILYIYKEKSLVMKTLAVFTISNNIAYVITYTAEESSYDNYISDIDKMIDSFRIIE